MAVATGLTAYESVEAIGAGLGWSGYYTAMESDEGKAELAAAIEASWPRVVVEVQARGGWLDEV